MLKTFSSTYQWLTHYGFPKGELKCCKDKRAELHTVKDTLYTVIDDRPRTMVHALHVLGVKMVYSLRHPYNQNLSDIPGVHLHDTWVDILDDFMTGVNNEQ